MVIRKESRNKEIGFEAIAIIVPNILPPNSVPICNFIEI